MMIIRWEETAKRAFTDGPWGRVLIQRQAPRGPWRAYLNGKVWAAFAAAQHNRDSLKFKVTNFLMRFPTMNDNIPQQANESAFYYGVRQIRDLLKSLETTTPSEIGEMETLNRIQEIANETRQRIFEADEAKHRAEKKAMYDAAPDSARRRLVVWEQGEADGSKSIAWIGEAIKEQDLRDAATQAGFIDGMGGFTYEFELVPQEVS